MADRRFSWLHPPPAFLRDDPGSTRTHPRRCISHRVCSLRQCACRDGSRSTANGLCCCAAERDAVDRPANQVCASKCGFLPLHAAPAGCNCFLRKQISAITHKEGPGVVCTRFPDVLSFCFFRFYWPPATCTLKALRARWQER